MELKKMFVLVPSTSSATVESIKTMSLGTNKIYFMAKYSQIVAKGTVYGVDPSTGQELESLVSVLGGTKGNDGTVTVDFSSLNYYTSEGTKTIIGAIGAIDAKVKAEMDKLASSKTLNDNYEFTGRLTYVAASDDTAAHIALVDEAGTELSTIAVSDIIGNGVLKTSAYNSTTGVLTLTFAQADGNEKSFEVDLKAMLDINDIAIDSESSNYLGVKLGTADSNGEQQALFSAKVVKVAEASDTKTGLVDAKDVKDYVDGKTTDLAVTATGDDYVSASVDANTNKRHVVVAANVQDVTYTTGTHATYNSEGIKIADGTGATISGVAKSLVDGEQATNAIKAYVDFVVAEEALRSDAKVLSSIKALDKESSTVDGNNIHINYKEEDGIVTIESVTEDYATINRTTYSFIIGSDDLHKLVRGSDLSEAVTYAFDSARRITGEIKQDCYNYTDVVKTNCYNYTDAVKSDLHIAIDTRIDNRISGLKAELRAGGDIKDNYNYISFTYSQIDGKISVSDLKTQYADFSSYTAFNDGIVTGYFFNQAFSDMWETYEG